MSDSATQVAELYLTESGRLQRRESTALKEVVADLTLENRLLKV